MTKDDEFVKTKPSETKNFGPNVLQSVVHAGLAFGEEWAFVSDFSNAITCRENVTNLMIRRSMHWNDANESVKSIKTLL